MDRIHRSGTKRKKKISWSLKRKKRELTWARDASDVEPCHCRCWVPRWWLWSPYGANDTISPGPAAPVSIATAQMWVELVVLTDYTAYFLFGQLRENWCFPNPNMAQLRSQTLLNSAQSRIRVGVAATLFFTTSLVPDWGWPGWVSLWVLSYPNIINATEATPFMVCYQYISELLQLRAVAHFFFWYNYSLYIWN